MVKTLSGENPNPIYTGAIAAVITFGSILAGLSAVRVVWTGRHPM